MAASCGRRRTPRGDPRETSPSRAAASGLDEDLSSCVAATSAQVDRSNEHNTSLYNGSQHALTGTPAQCQKSTVGFVSPFEADEHIPAKAFRGGDAMLICSYDQLRAATDDFEPKFRRGMPLPAGLLLVVLQVLIDCLFSCSIGRGGFGSVYSGVLNGRDVAIKRLRIEGNGENGPASTQGSTEFLQEIAISIRVRSPFILQLVGMARTTDDSMLKRSIILPESELNYAHRAGCPRPPWRAANTISRRHSTASSAALYTR